MKALAVGLLLLICAHGTSSAAIIAKRAVAFNQQEQFEAMTILNGARLVLAKEHNIANMHQLVYNHDFAQKASQMTCTSKDVKGPNYIGFGVPSDETWKNLAESKHPIAIAIMAILLTPSQTSIGCAKLVPPCEVAEGVVEGYCVIGPETYSGDQNAQKGVPGSACSDGEGEKGLCKSPKGADIKASGGSGRSSGGGSSGGSSGGSGGGSGEDSATEKTSNDVDSKSYSTLLFFISAYILVLLC
ncbi:hypothetical protein CRE_21741 [Caenorhabditis remanei]|uniref:SCP domain-containing protein n=1 Tax=Caenorhabditis remanei TaxID=31234 RepID=E3MEK0_CAERE|nr:hypothetical protein CRE_21741 [Caenorhabditis remanei]